MPSPLLPQEVSSPFGGRARRIQTLASASIVEMYRRKCGVDVEPCFHGHPSIGLYECERTGYRFWNPSDVAGDEAFYRMLSNAWRHYYRTRRWEYPIASKAIGNAARVLEIGCGRGYFLKSLEGRAKCALGLELNEEAIAGKVTTFPIAARTVEELARQEDLQFDAICSFQVLEHIAAPGAFLESAVSLLAPGGTMVLSTPNRDHAAFASQSDPFDLPPHHMGHFNEASYRAIAGTMGLDVVDVLFERREHSTESVNRRTQQSLAFRSAALVAKLAYNLAYAVTAEPGPTMAAVLRKR